jgi:regulatory protein
MRDGLRFRPAPKKKDAAQLWEYALKALGRRALAEAEIRQRLNEKAANAADVGPVMAKLAEYGYLNDERFAENFASARRANQGLGRMRVLRDLRGRRVGAQTAELAVEKTYAGADELTLAEEFVARKFRGRNLTEYLADPVHLASAYRKLRYAGFGSSACIRVLKRYSGRAEELEE